MEKKRQGLTAGINKEGLTEQGLTKDGTFFNDGVEMVSAFGSLPARPRYLVLSDGQILDRANQPKSNKHLWGMVACNRANEYRNIKSRNTRLVKLLLGLDRDITGLDGKRLNLLETVRYGIGGATLKEIKTRLMRPKCPT